MTRTHTVLYNKSRGKKRSFLIFFPGAGIGKPPVLYAPAVCVFHFVFRGSSIITDSNGRRS